MSHLSVLSKEIIENLDIKKGMTFLDATLGSGGHSQLVFEKAEGDINIIGLDQDPERIRFNNEKFGSKIKIIEINFRNIDQALDEAGMEGVDRILYDLGLNSEQLENSGKGFSFRKNEPLLMNFGKEYKFTAEEIVNDWEEENIVNILEAYGEEKFSKSIAKKIIERREKKKIATTKDLVEVISEAVPNWYKHQRTHFATKTFQALRITVNDELEALKESLEKGFERLNKEGRMAVISFHSLEDRIVKNFFKTLVKQGKAIFINKKAIKPQREEILENPRSRSAKLRIIQKI
jgi:16S rRNA (cytosine1402-N4)-methyltransferase